MPGDPIRLTGQISPLDFERLQQAFPEHRLTRGLMPTYGRNTARWDKFGFAAKMPPSERNAAALFSPGLLRGHLPDLNEPLASCCAVYAGSSLSDRIDACQLNAANVARAQTLIGEIRRQRVGPYCAEPASDMPHPVGHLLQPRYTVLFDGMHGSTGPTTPNMVGLLQAADRLWSDCQKVIVTTRAQHGRSARPGYLQSTLSGRDDVALIAATAGIWRLIENAEAVAVADAVWGFFALMAGLPVSCFSPTFYAGRGLTDDHFNDPVKRRPASLETLVAAVLIDHCRYADIHDGRPTSVENAVDALSIIARMRASNRRISVTVGLSPWKRRAVAPFLMSNAGPPRHAARAGPAIALARRIDARLAIWGPDPHPVEAYDHNGLNLVRMEDAFLRSHGLGAALHFPSSLFLEAGQHLHFDARGPSSLERCIAARELTYQETERAEKLRRLIIELRATKYMLTGEVGSLPETKQLRILVPGQVEDDASLRYGAPAISTNAALLAAVRELYPDALIAYREHPDVSAGLRPGKIDAAAADIDVSHNPLPDVLDWCDRVETMTSLTGFEALIRNVAVGTHGWPFYAGWGLTEDRYGAQPRGSVSLARLVHATLVEYPLTIHPVSRLPCSPERLVEALSHERAAGSDSHSLVAMALKGVVRLRRSLYVVGLKRIHTSFGK